MLIRYGYEMTFTCGAPTSMVSQLDVHPSCVPAVRAETPFAARPHVASWLYADVFGNRCRKFNAPSGNLTISNAGVIEVSGLPDPVTVDAAEIPVADLPDDTLLYLVGSRYVETDKLSQIAGPFRPCSAGLAAGAGDLRFRQWPHRLRLQERPFDADRV